MKNRKIIAIFLSATLVVFLGIYSYIYFQNNKGKTAGKGMGINQVHRSIDKGLNNQNTGSDNKYYVVEIVYNNGSRDSTFIPLKLNPDYKWDSDLHVSTSRDDNGNLINGDKIIEIKDFVISDKNKEKIKSIAGAKKYEEALKEIEDTVEDRKKEAIKNGKFKG
ncbi:hypothetical protein [Inconstantimicrobium mannanitabidum]|uniref:Uncharacterized protein n=1 Tax=Inconstantimicrobium mannanitabidum TaxID=1604901 RepID=A0ACB5RCZ6_9CLOT|nr:hypothetical protein [Clostridium sp. TW13]GKX66631.1 hypothetical protein rsdtw13_18890 [Clostridium sp. TW13]